MHGFLTHFILACFWGRSRPCGESLWCFSVITFSSTQESQFTTQDAQKIEVSFFFKREAVRIASNASLVWLILLPPPPTHCHLHLIGWEGPGTILKVFHHVASLFNRAFNKRVWCICPLTTVSFFSLSHDGQQFRVWSNPQVISFTILCSRKFTRPSSAALHKHLVPVYM